MQIKRNQLKPIFNCDKDWHKPQKQMNQTNKHLYVVAKLFVLNVNVTYNDI